MLWDVFAYIGIYLCVGLLCSIGVYLLNKALYDNVDEMLAAAFLTTTLWPLAAIAIVYGFFATKVLERYEERINIRCVCLSPN